MTYAALSVSTTELDSRPGLPPTPIAKRRASLIYRDVKTLALTQVLLYGLLLLVRSTVLSENNNRGDK